MKKAIEEEPSSLKRKSGSTTITLSDLEPISSHHLTTIKKEVICLPKDQNQIISSNGKAINTSLQLNNIKKIYSKQTLAGISTIIEGAIEENFISDYSKFL